MINIIRKCVHVFVGIAVNRWVQAEQEGIARAAEKVARKARRAARKAQR